jgi:hypothetical protein
MPSHINDIFNELRDISPVVADIPRNNVLSVPEHYFDCLDTHILFKIHDTYAGVPEGYFERLPGEIMNRIKNEKEAKVISVKNIFLRYAVAAILTGLTGLALFSLFNAREEKSALLYAEAKQIMNSGRYEEVFKSLPEEEIENYLSAQGHDVEAALVANAAYNKELPDEMDYLLKENTLDEFLKECNIVKHLK